MVEMRAPTAVKYAIARILRQLADKIQPLPKFRNRSNFEIDNLWEVPGISRIDWDKSKDNNISIRYRATDPIWNDPDDATFLVDLREHIRRLCLSITELDNYPHWHGWGSAADNLRMAYSLTDLFADTDLDGAGMWCRPAADYEALNSEITEKYLCSNIIFTFVWTAYECVIEKNGSSKHGKGGQGRDRVAKITNISIPHLRSILMRSLEFDRNEIDFDHNDMRRMLKIGSVPGISAEYLRQFRNRLAHGDFSKPEPSAWHEEAEHSVDQDPRLRQFNASTRLLLLIIQIMAVHECQDNDLVEHLLYSPCNAKFVLSHLHCIIQEPDPAQIELDLGIEMPTMEIMG